MLKTKDGITYYSSPNMEDVPGLTHAFLGRTGGVSTGRLSSLNLGRREDDSPENILENKKRVADTLGVEADKIFTVSQVHGDRLVIIGAGMPEDVKKEEADAIAANAKGISIGVLTADCVPILLFDRRSRVIAAIHAGWKGTALRIAEKTVRGMVEGFGSVPQEIIAAIGPSIGPCCYEVDYTVVEAVGHEGEVAKVDGDRWRIDLPKANSLQLADAGVREIDISGICTSCKNDLFFSHRKEKGKTGRQLSLISLLY